MTRFLPHPAASAVVAASAVALAGSENFLRFGAEILVVGTAAMSLDLLVGFGGLVSLGHAAVFGTAAYAAAIASRFLGGEVVALMPLGILTGATVGGAMGVLVARTGTLFLLVLTLLLGQIVYEAAEHWRGVTGGADGLRGLPSLSLGPWRFADGRSLFVLAAMVALGGYAAARSFVAAPVGRALVGTREQPVRMAALGYGVGRIRVTAAVLAGAVAGAAGVLYPFLNQYIGPNSVHWSLSASMVVMVVLGGVGSLWGAFAGAALFMGAQTYLSSFTDRWQLCVGLVFVLTVLVLPAGLAGLLCGGDRR